MDNTTASVFLGRLFNKPPEPPTMSIEDIQTQINSLKQDTEQLYDIKQELKQINCILKETECVLDIGVSAAKRQIIQYLESIYYTLFFGFVIVTCLLITVAVIFIRH
jgi:hypothetical protein